METNNQIDWKIEDGQHLCDDENALPVDFGRSWGPESLGYELKLDPEILNGGGGRKVVLDFETDEKDHFVGAGMHLVGSKRVGYFSEMRNQWRTLLSECQIIAHGIKYAEARWMKLWGIPFDVNNLYFDTALASYVVNPTRANHKLKDLADEVLKHPHRPDYAEMVGKKNGKATLTLDKQPVERVARYCGRDVTDEAELYQHFEKTFTPEQRRIFYDIEMPTMRLLIMAEAKGIRVDRSRLQVLDGEFLAQKNSLQVAIFKEAAKEFNINSWQQKLEVLKARGLNVQTTDKKELQTHASDPLVKLLLSYSEVNKLDTSFTKPLLEHSNNPESRVHTTYNQITKDDKGISTGRLSSSDPVNLQTIPSRTELGRQLRGVFIPKEGHKLVVLDTSQIEPRLLADQSQDPWLLDIFRTGQDLYDAIGEVSKEERQVNKKIVLATMYGVSDESLALQANVPIDRIKKAMTAFYTKAHVAKSWIDQVKWQASQDGYIDTLTGWRIPLPDIKSRQFGKRAHGERQAINFKMQSPAAHILKMAALNVWKQLGEIFVLTVHDELLYEIPDNEAEEFGEHAKEIMEQTFELSVPVIADMGIGLSWAAAKP